MLKIQTRVFRFLASVKLAVIVILAIGTITAIGTFVESGYDATTAQKLVYKSPYMYAIMILLIINLTAVMVDRWPWKKRHTGFVLAHIGIITLLLGAYITQQYGLDGSMRFEVGRSQSYVTTTGTEVVVYGTFDGDHFSRDPIYSRQVDFFLQRPSVQKPLQVDLPGAPMRVVDYMPYAIQQTHMTASSDPADGPALRFQIENGRVNVTQWISAPRDKKLQTFNMGPAQVVLTTQDYQPSGNNEIVVRPKANGHLQVTVFTKEKIKRLQREIEAGGKVETGWMGLVFRILDFFPHGREDMKFVAQERPSAQTTSAIKVAFQDKEYWIGLNSLLKLFTNEAAYVFIYENVRQDLGFNLQLKDFSVGHYQGTNRAASYQSQVSVPGKGDVVISMNEPLKYRGYTFYQASFEEDDNGKPSASILSVNRDPGRPLKYLGCILIVSGTIIMFYFKRKSAKANSKRQTVPVAS